MCNKSGEEEKKLENENNIAKRMTEERRETGRKTVKKKCVLGKTRCNASCPEL
jgi:coenzyme F420-reducing hydrogenase gamma subunit